MKEKFNILQDKFAEVLNHFTTTICIAISERKLIFIKIAILIERTSMDVFLSIWNKIVKTSINIVKLFPTRLNLQKNNLVNVSLLYGTLEHN